MTVTQACRVTVQCEHGGESIAVDLGLPGQTSLGEILPFIVETVVGGLPETTGRWVLTHMDGTAIDESMSLRDSEVHDGDILLLACVEPTAPLTHIDPCRFVVGASPLSSRDAGTLSRVGVAACTSAMALIAATLLGGNGSQTTRSIIAGLIAVIAAIGSVGAAGLSRRGPISVVSGVAAAIFGAVTGFLVVPGGPAPPNVFLAAAVCAAVATALVHVTTRGTVWFVAIAALSMTVTVAAAVDSLWPLPMATIGAALATAALALLGAAAKLAIFLSGLSPSAEIGSARAQRGHSVLSGLLAGFSLSIALGAVLVGVGQFQSRAVSGLCFTAVISLNLLLRARQHRTAARADVIFGTGFLCASMAFVSTVGAFPGQEPWVCLVSAAIGMVAVWLPGSPVGRVSPVVRRGIELVEYLALASVVPLACWVSGVFGILRGLNLP